MVTRTMRVGKFMTPCPYTVSRGQTLAQAHEIMRSHGIRHLPVLEGGKLVGVVSTRDLYFIETLRAVDPERVTVEEAMSQTPFVVPSDAPLEEVAEAMAANHYGCAVVTDGREAVGIFTSVDAMRALASLLRRQRGVARPAA